MRTARSHEVLRTLQRHESRNVTFIDPDGAWPIVWDQASGCRVTDLDGRVYLDLTAAFGVAACGHSNPAVIRAIRNQAPKLLHAMGDVHPHRLKAVLCERLHAMTFARWSRLRKSSARMDGKVILGNSGFEAVEAALKTAHLASGRDRVLAFEGAYHGLGYGALNATHRAHFREPFRRQLREFAEFLPYPASGERAEPIQTTLNRLHDGLERALRRNRDRIAAILVEPLQARGGIRVPVPGALSLLRDWCDQHGTCLILDEIYTGFGRTGHWFACEAEAVIPDLICLGKALTGGFPLSACVGRADWMDRAWPASDGEAIHTSTFLGHPVGCAMALAQIRELERRKLPGRAMALGQEFLKGLGELEHLNPGYRLRSTGRGLMLGLEFLHLNGRPATATVIGLMKRLLKLGYLVLPEGDASQVLSFTPPLTLHRRDMTRFLKALGNEIIALPQAP